MKNVIKYMSGIIVEDHRCYSFSCRPERIFSFCGEHGISSCSLNKTWVRQSVSGFEEWFSGSILSFLWMDVYGGGIV